MSERTADAAKDAIAPTNVNEAINRLCRRFGTERVLKQVKAWVEFIESAQAKGS